jgi:hypothetical protein
MTDEAQDVARRGSFGDVPVLDGALPPSSLNDSAGIEVAGGYHEPPDGPHTEERWRTPDLDAASTYRRRMRLRIVNRWSAPLSVAVMFRNAPRYTTVPRDFEMTGWWTIAPGAGSLVLAAVVDANRYWFAYAEAADGRRWTGPWRHGLPRDTFAKVYWGLSSPSWTVDGRFFRFDVDDHQVFTLDLT